MGLLEKLFGGTMPMSIGKAQSMADPMKQAWLGQYSIGLASGTSSVMPAETYSYKLTYGCSAPTPPTKSQPGTYRRGKVPEFEYLYSDSPLAWLDERVDEMRLVL